MTINSPTSWNWHSWKDQLLTVPGTPEQLFLSYINSGLYSYIRSHDKVLEDGTRNGVVLNN